MERSGNFYKAIRLGYILISILIGCMAYNSLYEWQEIEALELGNKKIDELRKEINNINIQMIKFSLLGETILEWNDKDIEHYHARRMAMDSMLCRFKATYPAERIDSVRSLLEDKERQMFQIVRLMDEQQSINKKIANQIPVIVQKSVQEQSKKPKRKGFLGIFGKKKEVTPIDTYSTVFGIRKVEFDSKKGFLLNGCPIKLKGTNLHQDHAGVGTAIPERLWEYRIKKLKAIGSNAIRTSHNPASPVLLDLCDRLGMLVVEENRLMGINHEHINLLERMIVRDRNHPCIILWSIGNEEWALEGNETGLRITQSMSEYVHQLDSTRFSTQGNAGGRVSLLGVDVKGYNYLQQNPIDEFHLNHPEWYSPIGSEETSGCGTRNVYVTDSLHGWMAPLNRTPQNGNNIVNYLVRGWQFYNDRPWLAGLFYWTGFDYRGEPNPMSYPSTGSQFGIFDYCGFPKDEVFYLKSWWTDTPVLHLSPHWNLFGQEGDSIQVWAYSNCEEVELTINGKNLGRKVMPANGYIEWRALYSPGIVVAKGYTDDKIIAIEKIETTSKASSVVVEPYNTTLKADGQDIAIVDLVLKDENNREVPDAMNQMTVNLNGPAVILGYGNGNPGFKDIERPQNDGTSFTIQAFAGKAQVIIRSLEGQKGNVRLDVSGTGLKKVTQEFIIK